MRVVSCLVVCFVFWLVGETAFVEFIFSAFSLSSFCVALYVIGDVGCGRSVW